MAKILITGGAGFIGSQLGYYLSSKHDVYLVDNMSHGNEDNLEIRGEKFGTFIDADIRDKNFGLCGASCRTILLTPVSVRANVCYGR